MARLWKYETACALRDYCVSMAWFATNSASGLHEDAERELKKAKELEPTVAELGNDLLAYVDACIWLSALMRMEQRMLPQSTLPAVAKFQTSAEAAAAADSLKPQLGVAFPEQSQDVCTLAEACGWYPANSVAGLTLESQKDVKSMVRAMLALYKITSKWRGVNLGGWLVLERGPSIPLYEKHAIPGDNGEWDATVFLRKYNQLHLLDIHREEHVTRRQIQDIADRGFNCLRVPFGYWIISGPTAGDPYHGPCIEHVDNVVRWAKECGLQVMLDLHGNPGGESQAKPCGRGDDTWTWDRWRRQEALELLTQIAARYRLEDHVTGLQVCNEPSRSIDPSKLVDHYVQCVAAVRKGGMPADRVSVVCPLFFVDAARAVGRDTRQEFLNKWTPLCATKALDGAVLDFHPYFFGEWANEKDRGDIMQQCTVQAELIGLVPASVVGEFACPFQTAKDDSCTNEKRLAAFCKHQELQWHTFTTHGDFYWSWIDGAFGWSRQAIFLDSPKIVQSL